MPQSFFQPSIQQLKRVPSRNQKSKMTESPFSVGTNVEFALQDESATSSVAVKWVGRAFPERLQLTFKEGVPHVSDSSSPAARVNCRVEIMRSSDCGRRGQFG